MKTILYISSHQSDIKIADLKGIDGNILEGGILWQLQSSILPL